MRKYENIFWHEGIRPFEDNGIKNKKVLLEIDHLENDVTKNFLNVLKYSDPSVTHTIIEKINQKNCSNISLKFPIQYNFQLANKEKFRNFSHQYLLKLISYFTPIGPNETESPIQNSKPDGAIFDEKTALIIEAKTQSPLVGSQIQNHIRNYAPNAQELILYWEEVFDILLELRERLTDKDRFLIEHFCEYLDILELSNFHKFTDDDFQILKHPKSGGIYDDETRADKLETVKRKLSKLDNHLWKNFSFPTRKSGRIKKTNEYFWFAYYPLNMDSVNLNFFFGKRGFHIDANAEKSSTFTKIVNQIQKRPDKFDTIIQNIDLDINALLFTKLPLGPDHLDNFYIKRILTIPKNEITAKRILNEIESIRKKLDDYKGIMFEEIKNNPLTNSQSNISYVQEKFFGDRSNKMNLHSKCMLRFEYIIPREQVTKMERDQLIEEITRCSWKMKNLLDFGNSIG